MTIQEFLPSMLQQDGIVLQKSCLIPKDTQSPLISGVLAAFLPRCYQIDLCSPENIVSFLFYGHFKFWPKDTFSIGLRTLFPSNFIYVFRNENATRCFSIDENATSYSHWWKWWEFSSWIETLQKRESVSVKNLMFPICTSMLLCRPTEIMITLQKRWGVSIWNWKRYIKDKKFLLGSKNAAETIRCFNLELRYKKDNICSY